MFYDLQKELIFKLVELTLARLTFIFFPGGYTSFYGLYKDVPLDCRVLFLSSLSETGYIISCDSVQIMNKVLLARLI